MCSWAVDQAVPRLLYFPPFPSIVHQRPIFPLIQSSHPPLLPTNPPLPPRPPHTTVAMPIPTESVGSLPRPAKLQAAYADYDAGKVSPNDLP